MKEEYDIELIIDKKCEKTKITICTKEKTKEIERVIDSINYIDNDEPEIISAYLDGKIKIIEKKDILRIRRYGRQVYLDTEKESYVLKNSITQLEENLDKRKYIRISQSEIINAYKVVDLDVSIAGTIVIRFCNGAKTNVSRRFVKTVKEFFERK